MFKGLAMWSLVEESVCSPREECVDSSAAVVYGERMASWMPRSWLPARERVDDDVDVVSGGRDAGEAVLYSIMSVACESRKTASHRGRTATRRLTVVEMEGASVV